MWFQLPTQISLSILIIFSGKQKLYKNFEKKQLSKFVIIFANCDQLDPTQQEIKFMKEEKFICLQNNCNISLEKGIIYALEKVYREK